MEIRTRVCACCGAQSVFSLPTPFDKEGSCEIGIAQIVKCNYVEDICLCKPCRVKYDKLQKDIEVKFTKFQKANRSLSRTSWLSSYEPDNSSDNGDYD